MNTFQITIQRKSGDSWPVVVEESRAGVFLPVRKEGVLEIDKAELLNRVSGSILIERLRRLGDTHGLPRFAFLATCESASSKAEGALGGLAQRLVRQLGMPGVVAMTEKFPWRPRRLWQKGSIADFGSMAR